MEISFNQERIPQRLKPAINKIAYRSAEALRHAKSNTI
jgi:hypothetical protein